MKWLLAFSIFFSQLAVAEVDYEVAFNKLKGAYTQCQTKIDNRDVKIAALEQQISNFESYKSSLDSIVMNLKGASDKAQSLINKQQTIIALSNEIEMKYQANAQLCQQSMDDLVVKVKELNNLYNQAFKECLKPWYARWETWVGFAVGLAIGIPI